MSKVFATLLAAVFAVVSITPVAFAAEKKEEKKEMKKDGKKADAKKTDGKKKKEDKK